MKLITRDTDYAFRAICLIAKSKGVLNSTAELAKKLKVPRPFLRKLLQVLTKRGVLKSFKGNSGGFILTRKPSSLSLLDLLNIFQGSFVLSECTLNKRPCPNIRKCPIRKKIKKIEVYVLKELKGINISYFLKDK